jgi:hypothetical protein
LPLIEQPTALFVPGMFASVPPVLMIPPGAHPTLLVAETVNPLVFRVVPFALMNPFAQRLGVGGVAGPRYCIV